MIKQMDSDDFYSKRYGNDYTDKMKYLRKVVTEYTTGKDQFNVLNFEAALGKSRTVDKILADVVENKDIGIHSERKYLIVKAFNEESTASTEVVNGDLDKKHALCITHENWPEWRKKPSKLKEKQIIFISHQRYILLCEDDKMREAFSSDRHTLIIDEKINFPTYTYSDKRYLSIYEMLPYAIRESLVKVTKPLNEYLEQQRAFRNQKRVQCPKFNIHPATLKNFIKSVKTAIRNNTIYIQAHKIALENFIRDIELIYDNVTFYNNNTLTTFNPKHGHWGLENNIILDASASIDGVYQISNKYNVINQSRIIDHSNSKFIHIKFNTSKYNVKVNSQKYFEEISKKIIKFKDNEKVLVVTHKEFAQTIKNELEQMHKEEDIYISDKDTSYKNESLAIGWYGNLIGKNWARDFHQVWLISTPNIPLEQYPIFFLQYGGDKIGNKSLTIDKGKYKNKYFSSIQKGFVAAEMYQALKRIQRNDKPKGKFYIVNSNDEIVSAVLSQIKNSDDIEYMELDFVQEEKEKKEAEQKSRKKPDQVDITIDFLLSLEKGKYAKSEIADTLNIKNLARVLADSRVKPLIGSKVVLHKRLIEII